MRGRQQKGRRREGERETPEESGKYEKEKKVGMEIMGGLGGLEE